MANLADTIKELFAGGPGSGVYDHTSLVAKINKLPPRHPFFPRGEGNPGDTKNAKHVTMLDPNKLHSIQTSVNKRTLLQYAKQGHPSTFEPIEVEHYKGKHVILDGHHRAAVAKLSGTKIPAYVHEPKGK